MYCIACGKEIKEDSRFCPYCGEEQGYVSEQNINTVRTNAAVGEIVLTADVPWNAKGNKIYIYVDEDEYYLIPKKSNTLTVKVTAKIHTVKASIYRNGWAEKFGGFGDRVASNYGSGVMGDVAAVGGAIASVSIKATAGVMGLMYTEYTVDLSDGGTEYLNIKVNSVGAIKITRK